MAIFHLSHDSISRAHVKSSMRSCAGKAAYIAGVKLQSQSGIKYDFSTKKVLHSEIVFPHSVKDRSISIEQLWKQVDRTETRKNSRTAEYFDVALPCELYLDQNIEIMRKYCSEIANTYNVIVQYAIHPPDGDKRNIHCHFMFHTRDMVSVENEQIVFGKKLREWSGNRNEVSFTLEYWRKMWAEVVNEALLKAGFKEIIDHRSNTRRGIKENPGEHNGPQRTAWARKQKEQEKAVQKQQNQDPMKHNGKQSPAPWAQTQKSKPSIER